MVADVTVHDMEFNTCSKLQRNKESSFHFNPQVAVQDLTVAVKKGEVFGLLGPNGAGKTTSINMLIGFLSPSAGYASISGFDLTDDMQKIYTLMGVCPQHNLLWGALTGEDRRCWKTWSAMLSEQLSQCLWSD